MSFGTFGAVRTSLKSFNEGRFQTCILDNSICAWMWKITLSLMNMTYKEVSERRKGTEGRARQVETAEIPRVPDTTGRVTCSLNPVLRARCPDQQDHHDLQLRNAHFDPTARPPEPETGDRPQQSVFSQALQGVKALQMDAEV